MTIPKELYIASIRVPLWLGTDWVKYRVISCHSIRSEATQYMCAQDITVFIY